MRFLIAIFLLHAPSAFASQPEVFVESAVMTPNAETLIVRLSYCGDQGNFRFDLKPCAAVQDTETSAVRCYEVLPKSNYPELCRRVITRTETFDFKALGDSLPPSESLVQLRGSRESLTEVRTPKH